MDNAARTPARCERAKFWRQPEFGNLELLRATYITHAFCRHIHEAYTIGVIEQGVEKFTYPGKMHFAPAGTVVIVNPGEVHTGSAGVEHGWTYRVLYPDVSLLQQAAAEAFVGRQVMPYFPQAAIGDRQLAQQILQLHQSLETSPSQLEKDTRWLGALVKLIQRHAGDRPTLKQIGREDQPIVRIKSYLESNYTENISLDRLAAIANLSPFYLLRTFRDRVGMPPYEYLTQVRVAKAKRLLSQGYAIAQVAQQTGFADQSHLIRQFKRFVGVTPGKYSHALTTDRGN
ncbi:MAG: HTH-type transcriptional activator RhaR [Chroococcidiopsis sp. SAG 2025]|nr:HTH-type transcriptional activator RhaR [Chroococcidiopsis sp. SAG 2025]